MVLFILFPLFAFGQFCPQNQSLPSTQNNSSAPRHVPTDVIEGKVEDQNQFFKTVSEAIKSNLNGSKSLLHFQADARSRRLTNGGPGENRTPTPLRALDFLTTLVFTSP